MWAVDDANVCQENVVVFLDPHSHVFHMSEWTYEGLAKDLNLPGM